MEYNFNDHIKGDTLLSINFIVTEDGQPKDLTGATIKMEIVPKQFCDNIHEISTDNGDIVITSALLGRFQIIEQVIDYDRNNYYYEMKFMYPDNTIFTYLKGRWRII